MWREGARDAAPVRRDPRVDRALPFFPLPFGEPGLCASPLLVDLLLPGCELFGAGARLRRLTLGTRRFVAQPPLFEQLRLFGRPLRLERRDTDVTRLLFLAVAALARLVFGKCAERPPRHGRQRRTQGRPPPRRARGRRLNRGKLLDRFNEYGGARGLQTVRAHERFDEGTIRVYRVMTPTHGRRELSDVFVQVARGSKETAVDQIAEMQRPFLILHKLRQQDRVHGASHDRSY